MLSSKTRSQKNKAVSSPPSVASSASPLVLTDQPISNRSKRNKNPDVSDTLAASTSSSTAAAGSLGSSISNSIPLAQKAPDTATQTPDQILDHMLAMSHESKICHFYMKKFQLIYC